MALSPLVLFAVISAVMSTIVGVLVADRWQKPGANWFVICAFGTTIWSGGYAVGLLVFEPDIRWLFEIPIWIGHGVAPVAFFIFVFRYTGRLESLPPLRHALLWLVPVLTVVIVLTNGQHGLMWSGYTVVSTGEAATVQYQNGLWLYVHKSFSYVLLGTAGFVLLQTIAARDSLYTAQAVSLIAVVLPLSAASVAWLFGLSPTPQIEWTPLLFGPVMAVVSVALFRSSVFDSAPAARRIGKRRVIDDFDDGVVLLDDTDRIVDTNATALEILESTEPLIGSQIESVLGEATPVIEPGRKTVRLETVAGHREYEIAISIISNDRGTVFGHSLVFRDVTETTQRQQRLTVLNRILRHNLRNDLNVVSMYATELEETTEGSTAEMAETIGTHATKLAALGEQARRIETALEATANQPQALSLEVVLEEILEDYRREASISVTMDGDLELQTYPATLETVLVDVIENAVRHGHGEVTVTADGQDSVVTVAVTDNGPGIPDQEVMPILAGTETALEHASGLGLWAISWGTAALDGSVSFNRPDNGGTCVEIRLPRALER